MAITSAIERDMAPTLMTIQEMTLVRISTRVMNGFGFLGMYADSHWDVRFVIWY